MQVKKTQLLQCVCIPEPRNILMALPARNTGVITPKAIWGLNLLACVIHDTQSMSEILLLSLLYFVCEDRVAVKERENKREGLLAYTSQFYYRKGIVLLNISKNVGKTLRAECNDTVW